MSSLYVIDLLGTFVFAISGVLTAVEKKFDVVGATIIGAVTAVGGGTLRDVLIGQVPVGWMLDLNYVIFIFSAVPVCYYFRSTIQKWRRGVFLFDTVGIGLFAVLGLQKTLGVGLSPVIALLMGVVSAVFGGVIRDVLCNEIPLIFRKEIYASACLAGGLVYLILEYFIPGLTYNLFAAVIVVICIRSLAVIRKWALPFNPKN